MRVRRPNQFSPPVPYQINWESPQAIGLVSWQPVNSAGTQRLQGLIGPTLDAGNSPLVVASEIGWAVDALSGYYVSSSPPVTAVPLTMSAWVYPRQTVAGSAQPAVGIFRTSIITGNDFILAINASRASAFARGGGTAIAASTVAPRLNEWQLITAVFDSNTSRSAFLNGSNKGTNTTSTTPTLLDKLAIGSGIVSNNAKQLIADVRIYNRALTDNEVYALYDPRTRWDLYRTPARRVWENTAPAFNPAWAAQSNQILGGGF